MGRNSLGRVPRAAIMVRIPRRTFDGRATRGWRAPLPRRGQREETMADAAGGGLTPPAEKTRVAVCDDHEQFRRGVVEMLAIAEDVEVVGEASTHDEAVAVVSETEPDVVLLDLEMPG